MRAGALDRRISLQRAVAGGKDDFGGKVADSWPTIATVAAQHTPVSDGERIRALQQGAAISDRFLVRYSARLADLGPKDQLTFEGRLYGIVGVKPVGRRDGLEITAVARAV